MMFSQSTSSTAILDNCNMVSPMRSNRQNPCEKESRHHPTSFCKVLGASFLIILYNTKFITPTVAGNGNSPGEVKKMEAMKNAWSDDSSTHPVLRLDYSNFESTVFHSGKNGMVKFYQTWCGHSIRLKPVWDHLAKDTHPSAFIANVDCGLSKDLCRSYHITKYPTLRYYIDGTEYDYDDALSIESLREFVDANLVVQCNPLFDLGLIRRDERKTSLKSQSNGESTTCSQRALNFAKKWIEKTLNEREKESERLEGLLANSDSTTAELRSWMRERRDMLKVIGDHQLHSSSDEL
mmetsp:Transcript_20399/g.41036  ORF Transcript_20399/g.41036 Transcript_20399/m.41036 type:complete len:294 (+) Transcript_20399:61-942(+)